MALEMKSKDLFFRDNPRIGWFFARPKKTLIIFLVSGLSICVLVWLVSTISGKPLGSLPTSPDRCDGCNVGFFLPAELGVDVCHHAAGNLQPDEQHSCEIEGGGQRPIFFKNKSLFTGTN
jgi:hypothetical protein